MFWAIYSSHYFPFKRAWSSDIKFTVLKVTMCELKYIEKCSNTWTLQNKLLVGTSHCEIFLITAGGTDVDKNSRRILGA